MKKDNLDLKIRESMVKISEDIQPSDDMFEKIKKQIEVEEKTNKKVINMKNKKKIIKVASIASAILITSVGVYAGGIAKGYFSSSTNIYKYKEVPTIEQMEKETGIRKSFVKEFKNGYKFDGAMVGNISTSDENNKELDKTNQIDLIYKKFGEEDIFISAYKKMPSEEELAKTEIHSRIVNIKGTELFVSSMNMKFVPPDYKVSEEEKKMEKEGKISISYGTDKVENKKSVSVVWEKDGVRYSINSLSEKGISEQSLIDMAEELL